MKPFCRGLIKSHHRQVGRNFPGLARFATEAKEEIEAPEETEPVAPKLTPNQKAKIKKARFQPPPKQPHHLQEYFGLRPEELEQKITDECEELVAPILGIQPPISQLELGTQRIKFQVIKAVSEKYGIKFPSFVLANIKTVDDIQNHLVEIIQSKEPDTSLEVPANVHLFIEKYRHKRERRIREKITKMISDRKRWHLKAILEKNWGEPRGEMTDKELFLFTRMTRHQMEKSHWMNKYAKKIRRGVTRRGVLRKGFPGYKKNFPHETREVFLGSMKKVFAERKSAKNQDEL